MAHKQVTSPEPVAVSSVTVPSSDSPVLLMDFYRISESSNAAH